MFFARVKLFFVPISHTGRIVIPKKIREELHLEKGDLIIYEKRGSDCLSLTYEYLLEDRKESKICSFAELGFEHTINEYAGHSFMEENFRVFIPKSFRKFASIEEDRKNYGGEVVIAFYFENKRMEVWNKKKLLNILRETYRDLCRGNNFYMEPLKEKLDKETIEREKKYVKQLINEIKKRISNK